MAVTGGRTDARAVGSRRDGVGVGGVLAAMYVFKVLGYAFTEASDHCSVKTTIPARMEWTALLLASGAILLGFLAPLIFPLLDIGSPFGGSFDAFSNNQEGGQ